MPYPFWGGTLWKQRLSNAALAKCLKWRSSAIWWPCSSETANFLWIAAVLIVVFSFPFFAQWDLSGLEKGQVWATQQNKHCSDQISQSWLISHKNRSTNVNKSGWVENSFNLPAPGLLTQQPWVFVDHVAFWSFSFEPKFWREIGTLLFTPSSIICVSTFLCPKRCQRKKLDRLNFSHRMHQRQTDHRAPNNTPIIWLAKTLDQAYGHTAQRHSVWNEVGAGKHLALLRNPLRRNLGINAKVIFELAEWAWKEGRYFSETHFWHFKRPW